ncbi:uncharacterized protein BJ212DRAFT_1296925 [Suillus subaureus]|uniref:Uncharacterized protein n=1 Tax=Suillus subaureus TaxID=48587 RepID=A0A9P7EHD2_9AGAM|nr:uncharacterized protein BJ212DRAFT_1296925 [Suillus subaureus]KAG1821549.1 hypothetical protein BJ212DRAFT_1296925 [Suillus subaureus]
MTFNLSSPSQLNSIHSPHIPTAVFPPHPFRPPLNPLVIFLLRTIMSSSSESRYIRLEESSSPFQAHSRWNLHVHSKGRWKLAIKVIFQEIVVCVTCILSGGQGVLCVRLNARQWRSHQELQMLWDGLLGHGDRPFGE